MNLSGEVELKDTVDPTEVVRLLGPGTTSGWCQARAATSRRCTLRHNARVPQPQPHPPLRVMDLARLRLRLRLRLPAQAQAQAASGAQA